MTFVPYELMVPPQSVEGSTGDALENFCAWLVTGEDDTGLRQGLAALVRQHCAAGHAETASGQRLVRLHAPLAMLLEALRYNQAARPAGLPLLTQLYIAQAALADLPAALRDDLPTPLLVRQGGRGDVYNTSLWLGLEPTYSPWHRDPNPNLFCQLGSGKTIRLAPPGAGERLFRQVQTELRQTAATAVATHARFRGEEMMQGPERQPLHDAIWASAASSTEDAIQEACVVPGDMLFIPKGWWHSVKSVHADGRLNASVNWWFR